MKKTLLTIFLLSSSFLVHAQKELWGVNKGIDDGNENSTGYKGNITKYDSNGQNPVIVHEFLDFATGKTPKGDLFLASNGKLYGMTVAGGKQIEPPVEFNDNGYGVLYEYDLIFDKYTVVHYFDKFAKFGNPVIEPIAGKLYGSVSNKVFCYDLATKVFTYLTGATGDSIDGELMKASNGFLYCTTKDSFCPDVTYVGPNNFGTIIKVNTTNNSIQQVYQLKCDGSDGIRFSGKFTETVPGKLINSTEAGGDALPGNGIIFEFDINTNTFTKKLNFDGNNLGSAPQAMVNADNGKLYGVCLNGGTNVYFDSTNETTYTNHWGTLFDYNPTSNSVTKHHDFGNQQGPPYSFSGSNPTSIMRASSGDYFGISLWGIFKFNPVSNSVTMPIPVGAPTTPNANVTESLIEICRKPSYHEFAVDTFDQCVNTPFTFDVHNTNAISYTWRKNGTIVPQQTTGILTIPNLAITDSGTYTCEMVNECGTTVTTALQLNVGCMSIDAIAAYKNLITLYPNPAKDILNIQLPENSNLKITRCTISNMLGQIVFESNGENTQIDTANYATGMYSLVLKTDKGNWFGKFMKE